MKKNKRLFIPSAMSKITWLCLLAWIWGFFDCTAADDHEDADSIAQQVRVAFHRNATLFDSAKDRHIVAFLGNRRAGKSTLVNFLAGKELVVSDNHEDYVLAHPHDATAMVIGTKENSGTPYPKFIDVGDLRFFDLPDFNDTDGTTLNLVNAAFIRHILLGAASVRLVIVAGEDQFTAAQSSSVKELFDRIEQLFVVGQDNIRVLDECVFVATKVNCTAQTEIMNFLLERIDSKNREALNKRLKPCSQKGRLCRMFHPLRKVNNKGVREKILGSIQETSPAKIIEINASVLYPFDTQEPLERMFLIILKEFFDRKLGQSLQFLSDYDKALDFYASDGFWQTFDAEACRDEGALGLLKEFYVNPYNKAMQDFKGDNEGKLQNHIQSLRQKRQERVGYIEKRTEARVRKVISIYGPQSIYYGLQQEGGDFVPFDFAYHKDFYDHVCGADWIQQITTDALEQDVVHRYYAGFISRHSHDQVMRWHQKFGNGDVGQQLAKIKEEITAQSEEKARVLERANQDLKAELTRAREEAEQRAIVLQERLEQMRGEFQARLEALEPRQAIQVPLSSSSAVAGPSIPPPVAQGYEEIYLRFLRGVLIYRPNQGSDVGMVTLPIKDLANPLEGTFDLSRCGGTGKYLSIATGYKKGTKPENKDKVEVWFAPRFLIEKELNTTAAHFKPIMGNWKQDAPVGMFWTWWNDDLKYYDYLTTRGTEELSKNDLHENWQGSADWAGRGGGRAKRCAARRVDGAVSRVCETFTLRFVPEINA